MWDLVLTRSRCGDAESHPKSKGSLRFYSEPNARSITSRSDSSAITLATDIGVKDPSRARKA